MRCIKSKSCSTQFMAFFWTEISTAYAVVVSSLANHGMFRQSTIHLSKSSLSMCLERQPS